MIRKTKQRQKIFKMTTCRQIVTSMSFSRFIAKLEQIRNLGAESIKLTFSLKVTFCLTKNENRTKKSLTQRSNYCFE